MADQVERHKYTQAAYTTNDRSDWEGSNLGYPDISLATILTSK